MKGIIRGFSSRKLFLIVSVFCLSFFNLTAQNSLVWHFGKAGGKLDFRDGSGGVLTDPISNCSSAITTSEGSSGYTYSNGTELFYTDGTTVFYPDGTVHEAGFLGDESSSSSAIIVPAVDYQVSKQFYLFTVDGGTGGSKGVHYSILDFTNPTSAVTVLKNKVLSTYSTEKITVIPKGGSGYWVVIPTAPTVLSTFELDGVMNETPVQVNDIGVSISQDVGWMQANQQGTQIGLATGALHLLDFNNASGVISLNSTFSIGGRSYGVVFSPDGTVLYSTNQFAGATINAHDLTSSDVAGSLKVLYTASSGWMGAIQVGPNGKIYAANGGGTLGVNFLHQINDPDNFSNPDFVSQGLSMPCNTVVWGLPTFVPGLTFKVGCIAPAEAVISESSEAACDGNSITLTATSDLGKHYTWYDENDLEVGTSGIDKNTLNISTVGTKGYYVVISDPADLSDVTCKTTSLEKSVTIYENPSLGTGASITGAAEVCTNAADINYVVDDPTNAANANISYSWSFNPNNTNFTANGNGDVNVSFGTADVGMTVEISEKHGSLVCTGGTVQKIVTVDPVPEITFQNGGLPVLNNILTVPCVSVSNKFQISNYDPTNYDYTIGTVSNATNVTLLGQEISFDASSSDGSIELIAVSKTGAKCQGTGLLNFTTTGCINGVSVVPNRVCPGELVTFTSTAVAGTLESILGYSWSVTGGVIVGDDDLKVVTVRADNSTNSDIVLTATVNVVFKKLGIELTLPALGSVIVSGVPDLSSSSIVGQNPVCEGSKELYTYSDATYSSYNWSVVNAAKTSGGNNKEIQEIDFANSVLTDQVELSVEVGKTIAGVECFATDQSLLIDIDALPVVTFSHDPLTVACNSTANTTKISNYDASTYTYSVGATNNVANVSLLADELTFDVTSTSGSIEIIAVSKTGALCQGAGVMNYSTAGCSSAVSVNSARVCPQETVIFTSDAVATGGESIVSYSWTIVGDGAIQGASDQANLSVTVGNSTTSEVVLKAIVEVVFEKNGQQITKTTEGTVTVNPLPDLSSSAITGKNPVCEGATEIYTYSNSTYTSYNWSVVNGDLASGGNGKEQQGVSFANSVLTNQVEINVEIGETIGGVVCKASDSKLLVDIEQTPVIVVDVTNPVIQCNSAVNEFQITNYDPNSIYTVENQPSGMTVTIDNTGKVNIDAGTATIGGTIVIKQVSATGCESAAAATMVVSLTGCGRTVNFTVDAIATCHGDTITFTQNVDLGSGGSITNYTWSFGNGTAIDPVSGVSATSVRVVVQNLTATSLNLSGTLVVDFSDAPTQLSVTKSDVVVNQLPDLSVLGSITGPADVCVGSKETYTLTHPNSNDFNYYWTESKGTGQAGSASNERLITFDNITDFTIPVEVKVSVKDKSTACFSSDTLTQLVNVDEIPTVTFTNDPVTIPCQSTANKVTIANYDATKFTYSLGAVTNATNVSLLNGEVTFDVADLGGTIEILVVSKTGGLCSGNGIMNFITSGCNSDVTVNAPRVCPEEIVTFTSDAVAGQGETIESYAWSFVGTGTVVGATDQKTLKVKVENTTNTELTLTATVDVVFKKSNQTVTITTDGIVTVNPLPDLTTAQVNGKNPVCENAKELYTYSDATFTSYDWHVTNADLHTGGNDVEIQEIDFANSVLTDQVKVSVVVGENIGGVVCKAVDDTLYVDIEALPTVAIDASIGIQCSSSGDTIQINNYDATADYSTITYTGGLTGVTQPDASGIITFDAGTADITGSIFIPITKTSGAQCSSATATEVSVDVLGCHIGIRAVGDSCTTVDGVNMTFVSDLPNTAGVVGYRWEIVGNGATYTGPSTGPIVTGKVFNNTTSTGYLDVTLYVDYGGATGEVGSQLFKDFVKVHVRPDINEPLTITDGIQTSSCDGDLHDFVIPNIDPTREYTIGLLSSVVADEVLIETNLTDTISIKNGTANYFIKGTVKDPATGCVISDSVEAVVAVVPEFKGIYGDTLFCEYSSTQRDTAVYKVIDNSQFDVTWSVEPIAGSDVSGVLIQHNYADVNNNVYDTIVDVFVNGRTYMGSKYLLKAKGLYTGACLAEDSVSIEIKVDETFKVDFTIVPEKQFCEDNIGYFTADLSQVVDDVNGTFGTEPYHYYVTTWAYNGEDFKSDNLLDNGGAFNSAGVYYSEYTSNGNPIDTIREGEYAIPLDTTWSTVRGPFQLDDEISLTVAPQFCWHRDSDLVDTLEINPQEKPTINLLVNDEKIHVLNEVLNAPIVDVVDEANTNNDFDSKYILTWSNTNGDIIDSKTPNWKLQELDLQMPLGYDTIVYKAWLNNKACNVFDTAYLVIDYQLFTPTVFTPNGDGQYDTWHIENIEKFPNANVQIFNRWGSLVFNTKDYVNEEWDGTYNGNKLPTASYYFVIDLDDGGEPISGAVSIVR